jgi:hypothetical protein
MKSGQRYFGMTLAQIGILTALALAACVVIGILGTMMLRRGPFTQQVEPTYTLQPSPIVILSPTPWPTITPIPDWQEYSFAEDQAGIWLPTRFIGGETATSSETIMERLRATFTDETFADDINDVQGLLAIPEIVFFVFDPEFTDSVRLMYVGKEALNSDLDLSMDYHLNRMMETFTSANDRVVERQIAELDYYSAGKLVVESKVPAEDVETFLTTVIYMIQVDDTMWRITFRTGREEFKDYQQTIEASVNSFWVQP